MWASQKQKVESEKYSYELMNKLTLKCDFETKVMSLSAQND